MVKGSSITMSDSDEFELDLGHHGIGDDCVEKVVNYSSKFLLAGGAFGSMESCFLTPVPGSTTPMIVPALKIIFHRSILIGTVGGVYAGGVCTAAHLRDKDDHVNASIGGALSGAIFGIKYRSLSLGLGLATGLALVMGVIKLRLGTYMPHPFEESVSMGAVSLATDNNNDSES